VKYLHLFANEKFTEPYIEFINKNFDSDDHLFMVIGKGINAKITPRKNVKKVSKDFKSLLLLLIVMLKCKNIYLHGLFIRKVVLLLFMQPWLLKKCNWIVWGGDLYHYEHRKKSLKSNLYEMCRRFVIKNMGALITHIKGDYELGQKWYGAKGKHFYSFMYPSNLFREYDLSKVKKKNTKKYIQVGNSADPTNNHLEVFNKLKKFKSTEIEIICPLSYGNVNYRDKIIEEGTEIFGENFKPVVDFLPFNQYLELLAKIDVAIFNHKRQQAIGNITTLLGLGKKVFIRDDITTWSFCTSHELKVYSINEDIDGLLDEIPVKEKRNNINKVKNHFSESKLISDWNKIFSKGE
jgi:dTDP-N-acetylfucosamine:lipid II N-acetylfucosaminyltransferase